MTRNLNVLIKPSASLCNMECSYCFYKQIREENLLGHDGFMSINTLEVIVQKAFDYTNGGINNFSFQGGEPTLIGLDFFTNFIEIIEKYNLKQSQCNFFIQTNGYEIDDAWGQFFKKNNFLVGLSLDGNKTIHDQKRLNKAKLGTYEAIIKNKEKFDFYNIDYNILTVVDNKVADNIETIYNHFKSLDVKYMQFIPYLEPLKKSNDTHLDNKHYLNFLKRLFDMWEKDFNNGEVISIKFFEDILIGILGYTPISCEMLGRCSIQNVIDYDGSVYPCDFYVYEESKLGNILNEDFSQILCSNNASVFISNSLENLSKKCKICTWKNLCKNGCKRYKYSSSEIIFCEAISEFLEYSIQRFVKIANKLVYTQTPTVSK